MGKIGNLTGFSVGNNRFLAEFRWAAVVICVLLLPTVFSVFLVTGLDGKVSVDSASYELSFLSGNGLLKGIRTPIYPLLVYFSGGLVHDRILVALQCLLYAILLVTGCRFIARNGVSRWAVMLFMIPFGSGALLATYSNALLPELTAAAFAFCALFSIIGRWSADRKVLHEVLVGFLIFGAVMTKPQYLFLVGVSIVTHTVLIRSRRGEEFGDRIRHFGYGLFGSTFPLVGYATVRWLLVGHFGLVSFGGANLAGIALNPLIFSDDSVEQFSPGELQDAALAIVHRRDTLLGEATASPKLKTQDPNILVKDALDVEHLRSLPLYDAMSLAYNANTWDVGRPALEQLYVSEECNAGDLNMRVDRMLSRLSLQVLMAEPFIYSKWLVAAGRQGLERFVRYDGENSRLVAISCTLCCIIAVMCCLIRISSMSTGYRSRLILVLLSVVLTFIVFPQKFIGMALGIWGWIPGTIAPLLLPSITLVYGLVCSIGCVLPLRWIGRLHLRVSQMDYMICCCTWYVVCGLGLVVAVEVPLDRYLITLSPPIVAADLLLLAFCSRSILRWAAQSRLKW